MSRKVKYILLVAMFIVSFSVGQNLVPNPSFDQQINCPTTTTQWNYCANWNNCNGGGTPDFFHSCATPNSNPIYNVQPPTSCMAYCYPHSGNGMMGLIEYDAPYPDYREYLCVQLSCPITPGNTYSVSFWVSTGGDPVYHKYSMNNLGVYFSASQPVQSGYSPILVSPDFEITSVLTNTVWVQYSFTVSPGTTCNYITIGNFRTDANSTPVNSFPSSSNWPYSYWYIDDVSVIGPPGSAAPIVNSSSVTCNAYSNGSATAAISSSLATTYTWLPSGGNSAVANGLSAGIYTLSYSNGCGSGSKTVSIAEPSPLSTALLSYTLICRAQNVVLNSNVTGGTAPYTYSWTNGPTTASITVAPLTTTNYTVYVNDGNGCNTMAVTTVSVDQCDALKEFGHTSSVLIYPNPAKNKIILQMDFTPESVAILDAAGKIVRVFRKDFGAIDLGGLGKGVYTVQVNNNGYVVHSQKLVIEDQ